MFNFTTQTIYNTINVAAANAGSKAIKAANVITSASGEPKPWVRFGNTRFDADHIIEIQHKKYTPESLAKVSFDLTKALRAVKDGDKDVWAGNYRIVLYIGLSMNSQDSYYANDFVYKGKPFYIEFPVKSEEETPADTIARIKKIAKKYMLFQSDEPILTVDVDPDNENAIMFEAVNGYQLIKKALFQKYDPNANQIDCCSTDGDFVNVLEGVPVMWKLDENGVAVLDGEDPQVLDSDGPRPLDEDTEAPIYPGLEEFCGYDWIIHNLRLPTVANTDFWAITRPEMPVVGGKYDQFIIRICYDRDNIGGEVVGQRARSVTTHVLYVLDDGLGNSGNITKVETELNKLVNDQSNDLTKIATDADDALSEPYSSVSEEEQSGGNGG